MIKKKEIVPSEDQPKQVPPMCMIGHCTRHHCAQMNFQGFWMVLCWRHANELNDFLADLPIQKTVAEANIRYNRLHSGFPSSTGMGGEDDIEETLDLFFDARKALHDVLKLWLYDHRDDRS